MRPRIRLARSSAARRGLRRGVALLGALGLSWLSCPSLAFANGRFPLANQLVVDPKSPAHMVARATFGILESDDGGATWTWICEDAVGYFGVEDPAIAVTADGSTIVASSRGLSVSRDGGCSWSMPVGSGGGSAAVDVAVDPTNPHEALALTSTFVNSVYAVSLVKTSDDGATWTDVGPLPVGVLAETVEIAPSNPDRVYVSARLNPTQESVLVRSDDGGQTWMESMIDLPIGASAFIGAVDPRDPDVVYVRVRVSANTIGRVLMTRDAGATWTQIWHGAGDVAGFALSPDGLNLAVGGPDSGVNLGSTSNLTFSMVNTLGASCLTWSGGKLFACGKEAIDLFSIGVSYDLGVNFTPVLHFPDITPRACGTLTSAAVCAQTWSSVASSIGIDAGAPDAGPEPVSLGQPNPAKVDAQGGWSCSVPTRRPDLRAGAGWLVVAFSLAAARKARTKSDPGKSHPSGCSEAAPAGES